MTQFRSVLYGTGSLEVACCTNPSAKTLVLAMPRSTPFAYEKLWMAAAQADYQKVANLMSEMGVDVGSLIDCFRSKSLVYNYDALERQGRRLCGTLKEFGSMACYRRQAYQCLLELAESWMKVSDSYPTNVRGVRLAIAAGNGDDEDVRDMLARHYDPSALHNLPLIEAVRNSRAAATRALINDPRVDAGANDSALLIYAAAQPDATVFDIVCEHPDVSIAKAGGPAALAAISEGLSGYALRLIRSPDWPSDHTPFVVDMVLSLGANCADAYPLLVEVNAAMKERIQAYQKGTKDFIRISKRLERLKARLAAAERVDAEDIDRQLAEDLDRVGLALGYAATQSVRSPVKLHSGQLEQLDARPVQCK